jgi:hypothetical protein
MISIDIYISTACGNYQPMRVDAIYVASLPNSGVALCPVHTAVLVEEN